MSGIRIWGNRLLIAIIAPTIVFGSRLVRNVILSRSLSPEEFGAAAAITVVIAGVGLVTDVALDRYVIMQNNERSLGTAHVLSIFRGILLAVAFVVFGSAFAELLGIPEFSGSFVISGTIPLILGFTHLGIKQVQREYVFMPEAVTQLASSVIAIFALVLGVLIFRDHRAILLGLIAEALALVAASHLLSKGPFRIRCDSTSLRTALAFGLPLTFNGLGLAAISQFDRMLAGTRFGVTTLGIYTVLLSISVVPSTLILSSLSKIMMSYLMHEDGSIDRTERYRALIAIFSILGTLYALLMALSLDWLIVVIYGQAYRINETVHVLMVAIVYFRMQRYGAPQLALLAASRTGELAILNISAGIGLVIAIVLTGIWPRFETLLSGVLAGEIISFALFFFVSTARVVGDGKSGISRMCDGGFRICDHRHHAWFLPRLYLAITLLRIQRRRGGDRIASGRRASTQSTLS